MKYAKPIFFFAGSAALLAATEGTSGFASPYREMALVVLGLGCIGMLYWGCRVLGDIRRRHRRLPKS